VLDVGHAPLCLILSGEPSYCDCSTCSACICSAFSIRTLAKTKEDYFLRNRAGFSLHVKQGEQHKTHKRRIKMSGELNIKNKGRRYEAGGHCRHDICEI